MISFVATHLPRLTGRFFPDLLCRVPTTQRTAYLTFDDGPTPGLTGQLLDVLARHDARATCFLIGAHARRDPALVHAMAQAGHTIGNHSFTHPDAWLTPQRRVLAELDRTTVLLEDMLGRPLRWMRPPYGRFTQPMRGWCQARRQRLTLWDVMPGDFLPATMQQHVEARVRAHLRPGSIVVLHDNPKTRSVTPPALDNLLSTLTADGWRFRAL